MFHDTSATLFAVGAHSANVGFPASFQFTPYEAWVAAAAYRESRTGAICTPVKALTLSPDFWATAI